jgi:two-component system, NarL family, invasion response regulator UvrY
MEAPSQTPPSPCDDGRAMSEALVHVLVVDDQAPFRIAARRVVGRIDRFEVVGEAATGQEAIALSAALHPAIVLMDINLPDISGIEATRSILTADPGIVVFLCSTYRLEDLPAGASMVGARGYIHKEELTPSLLRHLWAEAEAASRSA